MEKMEAFRGPNAKFLPEYARLRSLSLLSGPTASTCTTSDGRTPTAIWSSSFPRSGSRTSAICSRRRRRPRIDTANGGSAVEFPETLAKAIAEIKNVARVTTGHDEASASCRATPALPRRSSPTHER